MRSSSSARLISPSGSDDRRRRRRRARPATSAAASASLSAACSRPRLLAQLGPEHLEVGLDDVGRRARPRPPTKRRSLTLSSSSTTSRSRSTARASASGSASDDLGQRLARLDRRGVARGAAHLDDAPRRRHVERHAGVDGRLVGDRPGAQVHALGRRGVDRAHQVLVQLLGDERRERRQQLGDRHERLVQRVVGGQLVGVALALPEAAPAAAHVPVAEVVDELLDGAAGAGGVVGLEAVGDVLDQRVQLAHEPAVDAAAARRAATPSPPGRSGRCWRRA